jgi:hypothetical protein
MPVIPFIHGGGSLHFQNRGKTKGPGVTGALNWVGRHLSARQLATAVQDEDAGPLSDAIGCVSEERDVTPIGSEADIFRCCRVRGMAQRESGDAAENGPSVDLMHRFCSAALHRPICTPPSI